MFKEKQEWFFGIFLGLLVLIFKFPILNKPYFWDIILYVMPSVDHLKENIMVGAIGIGHPPLLYWILGLGFLLFGKSLIVGHLIGLVFVWLGLFFTYKLGKYLFNETIGIISSILLFFSPLFFAQSGILHLDLPLMSFTVMTIYFFLRKKYVLYSIIGSFLVLTKEPGILTIGVIGLYVFIKNIKKWWFKEGMKYSVPVFVFIFWMILNKLLFGWFLFPNSVSNYVFGYFFKNGLLALLLKILLQIKFLFFDNYKWILTAFIFLCVIRKRNIKRILKNKINLLYLGIGVLVLIALNYIQKLEFLFVKQFKNVGNYLKSLKNYKYLIGFLVFVFLIFRKRFCRNWFKPELMIIYLNILFYVLFFSISNFNIIYHLPIYPLLFIIFGKAINDLFKKKVLIIIICIIMLCLFVNCWFCSCNNLFVKETGFTLEYNMEYLDMVQTHKEAAGFLEENYPNATIYAGFPSVLELSNSDYGYISNKQLNIVGVIPLVASYKHETEKIGCEFDFIDIIYYSPQDYLSKHLLTEINFEELVLIKRFEKNNKFVELYKNEDKNFKPKICI